MLYFFTTELLPNKNQINIQFNPRHNYLEIKRFIILKTINTHTQQSIFHLYCSCITGIFPSCQHLDCSYASSCHTCYSVRNLNLQCISYKQDHWDWLTYAQGKISHGNM